MRENRSDIDDREQTRVFGEAALPKITYVCSFCGSQNVKCDAWVAWSVTAQSWGVADVFDDGWCDDCDGEARV